VADRPDPLNPDRQHQPRAGQDPGVLLIGYVQLTVILLLGRLRARKTIE
jgi:hypothetical protein